MQKFSDEEEQDFEGSDDFDGTQVFQSSKLRMSKQLLEQEGEQAGFEGEDEEVEIQSESH